MSGRRERGRRWRRRRLTFPSGSSQWRTLSIWGHFRASAPSAPFARSILPAHPLPVGGLAVSPNLPFSGGRTRSRGQVSRVVGSRTYLTLRIPPPRVLLPHTPRLPGTGVAFYPFARALSGGRIRAARFAGWDAVALVAAVPRLSCALHAFPWATRKLFRLRAQSRRRGAA